MIRLVTSSSFWENFGMDETITSKTDFIKANAIPLAVGNSAIVWGTLQYALFQTFRTLSEMEHGAAKAIYFAIKSDRSQRDMVTELIIAKLQPKHTTLSKKFKAIIGSVNALAGKRNDTLHVVYANSMDVKKTRLRHDIGYLKGKTGDDLISEIIALINQMLVVTEELIGLNGQLEKIPPFDKMAKESLSYTSPGISAELPSQTGYGSLVDPAKSAPPPQSVRGVFRQLCKRLGFSLN
jgi:hypothetical protein